MENTLNSLNQVNARVRLKEKEALVKLGTDISDGELRETVERLGYRVVSIESEW